MLYAYKFVASELSSRIEAGCLTAKDLGTPELTPNRRFDRGFQISLFRDILRWDSDKFLELVEEMTRTDRADIVNGIMFGQIDPSSLISVDAIRRLTFQRSVNIARHSLKGLLKSVFT